MENKKILIIAGPNGAGKTTFANAFLINEPSYCVFVNADLIAASLSPDEPNLAAIKAGRSMMNEMKKLSDSGLSFAFETTLAGRGYVQKIRDWRAHGYEVELLFLSLKSPEEAIFRVAQRVVHGGHHIPDDVVRRRFEAGELNFRTIYRSEVDYWGWYNNSGKFPILLDEGEIS